MKFLKLNPSALFLTMLLMISSMQVIAQGSIIEKLGGIKLNCTITTEGERNLEVGNAYLIKRAVSKVLNASSQNLGDIESSSGYESFHLEFITKGKIKTISKNGRKGKMFTVIFYDGEGKEIGRVALLKNRFNKFSNAENDKRTYAINLKGVPLILFEDAEKIDLTFKERN